MTAKARHRGDLAAGGRSPRLGRALHRFAALLLINFAFAGTAQAATVLVYGDSLVAGYGLPADQGFVPQLQRALDAEGLDAELVNAGVSGDTTQAGLARLDWSLGERPDAIILGLGANDMLRGVDPATTRANLEAILTRIEADDIPVLLLGMMANRGLGPEYVQAFDAIYPDLAARYDTGLVPFFLDGVAFDRTLNQPDGIHPNAEGVSIIVDAILPQVSALVSDLP